MSEVQNKATPTLVEVFTNFFRAVTRPAVTIIFAAVIAQVVIEGIDPPQWFLTLAIGCITWWFADRTVTHVKQAQATNATTNTELLATKIADAVKAKTEG